MKSKIPLWLLFSVLAMLRNGMIIGIAGALGSVALFGALRLGPAYIIFPVISVYPVVNWMQKYFHPYLVMDLGIHENNRPDTDLSAWPEIAPVYQEGKLIERSLVMFNDGLERNNFRLRWEARWDSAAGDPVDAGVVENVQNPPGFNKEVKYHMTAPETGRRERKLFIVLTHELGDKVVFEEKSIYFKIMGD